MDRKTLAEKNAELMKAIMLDETIRVKTLLKAGVELSHTDCGLTPLMSATQHGARMVEILLFSKQNVYINNKDLLGHDRTALIYAAYIGNLRVVKALIAAGASLTYTDSTGRTALDYAREQKREKVITYLEPLMHEAASTVKLK